MKTVCGIEFHAGSREERLPEFICDFPYIASRAELDKYADRFVPWHWHKPVELFYLESGTLEYHTPGGIFLFPAGSGGMVNSNVLHMAKPRGEHTKTVQLLHIFDASFIAGEHGSRIEQKYIMPVIAARQLELIALFPDSPPQKNVLNLIQQAFRLSGHEFGYEIKLRGILSEIWLALVELSRFALEKAGGQDKTNDKIKLLLVYIHEHYAEKISIFELAAAAFLSERACFRVFGDYLRTTPTEYMRKYRLQTACRRLAKGRESVTAIGHACGLGSGSYFGKVFREYMGCTPMEYRLKWQNRER